jgi:hypothetical protein
MADSTGPIVAAGLVTMGNELLGNGKGWAGIIPAGVATTIAAGLLVLVEHASRPLAVGIAWIALISALLVKPKSGDSAVNNLLKMTKL